MTSAAAESSIAKKSRGQMSFSSLRAATTPAEPPSGCLHPSKWAGIWGEAVTLEEAMARGAGRMNGGSATLVVPQGPAGAMEGVMGGFWGEIATVHRETGIKGLWKGVGTTM
jgi:solute carrier family 25 protein 39/40